MIISFIETQRQEFNRILSFLKKSPELYLNFEDVADVYQSQWIRDLPSMCKWYVSGLDDGAEQFYLSICFQDECYIFEPYKADL